MEKSPDQSPAQPKTRECPVCDKAVPSYDIEQHVNKCLFLNTQEKMSPNPQRGPQSAKRKNFSVFEKSPVSNGNAKKRRSNDKVVLNVEPDIIIESDEENEKNLRDLGINVAGPSKKKTPDIPLAEKMRPTTLDNYLGQDHIIEKNAILRIALDKNEIPSMILWGPPGCGKTTLAHIIANRCKTLNNSRFVKLSATMSGVNDVKEAVKVAKNEMKFNRKTILFMDEIHRFNKLQQDIFLPHVENGTITLIGATTENPSFSLNSALLSRCRVIILEKIIPEQMVEILKRAVIECEGAVVDKSIPNEDILKSLNFSPKFAIDVESIKWLADICDGDARIGLNSLQLAVQTIVEANDKTEKLVSITLDMIKEGIKKSHILYDRKGDQHYDMISALHKSIRASDDNASLYWCTRMIVGGEDPRYICRRLVRAASEDIGLADPNAISVALSALQAVQLVGMPESDCIITQCAVYLARAPKSRSVYKATCKCRQEIENFKGLLPGVPLHLRNAPTKLMKEMGCAKGYNLNHKDVSGLEYMPEGMEEKNYFSD